MAKASLKKGHSGNPKGIPQYLAAEDFQTMKDLAELALAKMSVTSAV
ncbi:hypothetical protein ACFL5L_00530 [candidate division KSB1 bacterium]